MSDSEKKIKFIPMLSQIQDVAKQLPNPIKATENTFTTTISGTDRHIQFERIEVYRSDKTKTYKWTFKGRLFIDSRYLKDSE